MRSFFDQPMFYHLIITLCLFITISNCADDEAEDFPVDENVKPITKCRQIKVEDMIKHVFVYGDNPSGIQLKCPVENKEFNWEANYQPTSDNNYDFVYTHFGGENKHTASGESLDTYALNIGKPDKRSSGIYCCTSLDRVYGFVPVLSHLVLIFSTAPEITLTSSNTPPVKYGENITLHCSKPSLNQNMSGNLVPKVFWEKSSVRINEAKGSQYVFEATPEYLDVPFRCGWKYENLFNNDSSKTFYSDPITLFFTPFINDINEELSTRNTDERIVVTRGRSKTLKCVFEGNPPVNQDDLIWTKLPIGEEIVSSDGSPIDYNNETDSGMKKFVQNVIQEENNVTTSFSLTINNFTIEDEAAYTCVYKMSSDKERIERRFNVQVSSEESNEPKNTASSNGQFLSLGFIIVSLLTSALSI